MAGAAFFALALTASGARAADEHPITIAPQPLDTALNELGSVGNQQILIRSDVAAGKTAHAVNEAPTFEAALLAMLDGTGLTWRREGATYLIVSASDPQSGSAAGDGAEGTVQALIVTAQKREENIQDVPIAMSAFTQEDLTRSQVAGGPDLMTQVPNFTFTKTNFSSYSIQIRGIGTQAISATTDAAVAVAFNNTPFIRNRFFEQEFYDLQRVEVLRGPQGTLYGRNATAGVVNIISAKPTFHDESRLSVDLGNYNSTRLEGMLNIPLVDDKVALRIAGAWTKRDGYDTNQITGNQIDGRDLWSTRVSLRFEPTDVLHANLIWEHFKENDDRLRSGKQLCHTDEVTSIAGLPVTHFLTLPERGQPVLFTGAQATFSQGCKPASLYSPDSFQTPNGLSLPYFGPLAMIGAPLLGGGLDFIDPYVSRTQSRDLRSIESTVDPQYQADTDTVELQFSVDLANNLTFTSETGYLSDTLFSMQDYNRFSTSPGVFVPTPGLVDENGYFCDPQVGCANRLVAVDVSTAKSRQFSQEFRLASNYDGPFNFSLGANFLRYDTEDKYYVFFNTITLTAALLSQRQTGAYVSGVSDNHQCLPAGFEAPNPNQIYSVEGCIYIDPNPISSLNDQGHNYFLSRNPYKLISYAAFGEAYYNITPNLKLTAGLRWTVDRKEAPRIPSWILAGGLIRGASSGAGYSVAEVIDQKWSEPTGRLTLDWKPSLSFTDDSLFYGSFAHGYKAGGANPPTYGMAIHGGGLSDNPTAETLIAQNDAHPKTFKPEFVNAFEVGSKNTLDGGRLTLNGDAFFYDYTGYQISEIVDRAAVNLNFDAKIWGLEFEGDWRPAENLRLGLKLGYEKTRMADGSKAIDLMDRTAGHSDWVVVSPFPTFPSNCILPASLFVGEGTNLNGDMTAAPHLVNLGAPGGGGNGGCELAYVLNLDPVTGMTYTANPTVDNPSNGGTLVDHPNYPGFNPATAPNGGAGFDKNLSGHELPNAPHYTATLTADYTLPLPSNWLMTLHTDLYYQSEAWTRVFNDPGYDKLKAYTNVNLAAIFSNEDAGWKVMAYVKNVFDRDSITGAFLNSDDTGLTTNVFLTEPRLYGLRVTKEWTGAGWWTGANPNHPAGEPYPLTVEVGGQVQRQDAPYADVRPTVLSHFDAALTPRGVQNQDLDNGDGREVRITYQPARSPWRVSAGLKVGRTNGTNKFHASEAGPSGCGVGAPFLAYCDTVRYPQYTAVVTNQSIDFSDATVTNHESHTIVDFEVGRDLGLGMRGLKTSLAAGLQYASFKSDTRLNMAGVPDWDLPQYWVRFKYSTHDRYTADLTANRDFKGAGPTLSWDGAKALIGNDGAGHVDLDWSVKGGVLFGKTHSSVAGQETAAHYSGYFKYFPNPQVGPTVVTPPPGPRTKSVTVPTLAASLGLSYEIQRIKVSTGYQWERYYNALDAGYGASKRYDRTIDGPYFKIAVGFGG